MACRRTCPSDRARARERRDRGRQSITTRACTRSTGNQAAASSVVEKRAASRAGRRCHSLKVSPTCGRVSITTEWGRDPGSCNLAEGTAIGREHQIPTGLRSTLWAQGPAFDSARASTSQPSRGSCEHLELTTDWAHKVFRCRALNRLGGPTSTCSTGIWPSSQPDGSGGVEGDRLSRDHPQRRAEPGRRRPRAWRIWTRHRSSSRRWSETHGRAAPGARSG